MDRCLQDTLLADADDGTGCEHTAPSAIHAESCRRAVPLATPFMFCIHDNITRFKTCMLGGARASQAPRRRATGPRVRVPPALSDPQARQARRHSMAPASSQLRHMSPRHQTVQGGHCWSRRPQRQLSSVGCSTRGQPRRSRRSTPLVGGACRRARPLQSKRMGKLTAVRCMTVVHSSSTASCQCRLMHDASTTAHSSW